MTIITKPLSQQEKEKKDGLSEKSMEEVFLKGEGKTSSDVEAATVISPNKRKDNSSNMCFVITVMLATCLGLTILGYYQLHRRNHPSLYKRGSCRLPCHMRRQQQQLQLCSRRASLRNGQPKEVLLGQPPNDGAALVFGDLGNWQGDNVEKDLVKTEIQLDEVRETVEYDDTFEFKYEMDLEEEKFEMIQMPDVSSGLYVHDFTVNRTGIIENTRCFVMVMDRNEIAPPRSLYDLLTKTTDDGYEMNLDEIQHDMMIVLPKLTNDEVFKQYGWFIGKACRGKTAFKLEPVPEEIAAIQDLEEEVEDEIDRQMEGSGIMRSKRSTQQAKVFQEVNQKFINYNIVNFEVADQ